MAKEAKNQNVNLKIVTLPQSVNVTIQVPFTSLASSRIRKEKKSSNMRVGNKHVRQLELFGTN
jgi:hypothetical protein